MKEKETRWFPQLKKRKAPPMIHSSRHRGYVFEPDAFFSLGDAGEWPMTISYMVVNDDIEIALAKAYIKLGDFEQTLEVTHWVMNDEFWLEAARRDYMSRFSEGA